MITLSIRTRVRNAAAVFSGGYGAVTRQAEQAWCSRPTGSEQARRVEQRLNAAAVFSGGYGAVTRQAEQAGCSRPTGSEQARRVEQRLQSAAPASLPAADPVPPAALLDEPTRRRLAVTAFAMGIRTRPIEELFRGILPDGAPDHSTIGRWVAHAAEKAKPVLQVLDAAAAPQIQTLARDAIVVGGGRLGSASNLGA